MEDKSIYNKKKTGRKTRQKGFGWYGSLNPNAGNVEKNVEIFNAAQPDGGIGAVSPVNGNAMGESVEDLSWLDDLYDVLKGALNGKEDSTVKKLKDAYYKNYPWDEEYGPFDPEDTSWIDATLDAIDEFDGMDAFWTDMKNALNSSVNESLQMDNGMVEDSFYTFERDHLTYHFFFNPRRSEKGKYAILVIDYGWRFDKEPYTDEKGITTIPVSRVHDKPQQVTYFEFTEKSHPKIVDAMYEDDRKDYRDLIVAEAKKHVNEGLNEATYLTQPEGSWNRDNSAELDAERKERESHKDSSKRVKVIDPKDYNRYKTGTIGEVHTDRHGDEIYRVKLDDDVQDRYIPFKKEQLKFIGNESINEGLYGYQTFIKTGERGKPIYTLTYGQSNGFIVRYNKNDYLLTFGKEWENHIKAILEWLRIYQPNYFVKKYEDGSVSSFTPNEAEAIEYIREEIRRGLVLTEATASTKYSYTGPIYHLGNKIAEKSKLYTMAKSWKQAKNNFLYKIANGDIVGHYDLVDEFVKEVPKATLDTPAIEEKPEIVKCEICGTQLNPMGECPVCDYGENDLLESTESGFIHDKDEKYYYADDIPVKLDLDASDSQIRSYLKKYWHFTDKELDMEHIHYDRLPYYSNLLMALLGERGDLDKYVKGELSTFEIKHISDTDAEMIDMENMMDGDYDDIDESISIDSNLDALSQLNRMDEIV